MINQLKKSLILLAILTVSFTAGAQTYSVRGGLVNDKEVLPFATVLVKKSADSSVVKVGIADSLGRFKIPGIPAGNYYVHTRLVGLKDYISESFELNKDIDLGIIEIQLDDLLEEVVVLKLRPMIEVLPDMVVFNVDNTINASGSDGWSLLRKAPGVVIDNDNNIIVEGKSGVQVFIDHKPSQLAGDDLVNFLMSMQASDIDKIEIITQPSSKYDAAGSAGIINIILKRDKRMGTNGTLGMGYGRGLGNGAKGYASEDNTSTTITPDNDRANISLALNNRTKVSSTFFNVTGNYGANSGYMWSNRNQSGTLFSANNNSRTLNNSASARFGSDFYIGSNHIVGFVVNGIYTLNNSMSDSRTLITPDTLTTPVQILQANNETESNSYNFASNVNYRFNDTLGHEFSLDVDYGAFGRKSDAFLPNEYLDGATEDLQFGNYYRQITPTDIDIFTAKADYGQYLWGGKLSFGGKYSLVNTANLLDFFDIVDGNEVQNADRSNKFFYEENINAGYINYGRKLGKKWNLQAGVRVENTNSRGELISTQSTANDTVERHYTNFFPSGGLTYTPGMKHMWSLQYSRRIQRPNYQVLNPFIAQTNELSYWQGNPFLQPQYISNVRLSHTFKYRFTTAVSYSYASDFFAQVTDTIGSNTTILQTKNVADNQVFNLSLSLPMQIKPWWNVFASVNASYQMFLSNGSDDKYNPVSRPNLRFYGSNTFLMKGWKFEVSGWWSSPSIWGGTYLTKSMGSMDVAVEKKLFKDNLSLRLVASDIFYTAPWRAELTYGDLAINASGGYESRRFQFQLTWNFGNSEVKKARERKTGLEDEEKRVSGSGE